MKMVACGECSQLMLDSIRFLRCMLSDPGLCRIVRVQDTVLPKLARSMNSMHDISDEVQI